jgi:hypothetical protein
MSTLSSGHKGRPDRSPGAARLSSPAYEANHQPILEVVRSEIADRPGDVLEIGSGPGQHIALFARAFSDHVFWPSDPMDAHRQSTAAWCAHFQTGNVMPPISLDAAADDWRLGSPNHPPASKLSGMICINVLHITPWSVAQGILRGAGKHLGEEGVLLVYGPFSVDGAHTATSNARFDASLRAENPEWGVRDTGKIGREAEKHGLVLTKMVDMPVNNFVLVLKRR